MSIQDAQLTPHGVAGYRVLRSLASDADAQVLVGFPVADGSGAPGADSAETVALKTMTASAERWSMTVPVLEALQRARGPHVIRALDIDAEGDRMCVIFERLAHGSLAELLTMRERLEAGEVVTIVAPLAEALGRMHGAGVAHGAVGSRTVMFRADGAPVLIGFGSSRLFPPGSPEVVLERQPAVRADRAAMRALACQLLARVGESRARAAHLLGEELESCPDDAVLEVLGRRLFDVAAAIPVRFGDDARDEHLDAVRVVPLGAPVREEGKTPWGATGLLSRVIPDAWIQRVLDGVSGSPLVPFATGAVRAWQSWSPARRRLVLGAVVAAVVVCGALTVVPPSATVRSGPAPDPSARSSSLDHPTESAPSDRTLSGDDPRTAALVLVAARERCLRSLSLLCLDGVDQRDSGARRDDEGAIRAAQRGGELPDPLMRDGSGLAPELVQRLGDSALVRLAEESSGPASLLLVKGEAGWRIRDVIAAPARVSPESNQGSN